MSQVSSWNEMILVNVGIKRVLMVLFSWKVHEFKVEMTCGGCSGAVERVLGKLGGKFHFNHISPPAQSAVVSPTTNSICLSCYLIKSNWLLPYHSMRLFPFADKVENVEIDLENKKVFVTSSQLNANQLLESIQKTGKETTYIGLKS